MGKCESTFEGTTPKEHHTLNSRSSQPKHTSKGARPRRSRDAVCVKRFTDSNGLDRDLSTYSSSRQANLRR
jgi:hypothetical protein